MPAGAFRFDGSLTSPGFALLHMPNADVPRRAVAPDSRPVTQGANVVLTQLERILADTAFDATTRNRAFLRYVVSETLAGRGDRIKAYTVGQEVFQRGADFDPQLDPVVRMEALNLRRSLERYYLTTGKADPVIISIPKGGYVPRFEFRDPADELREAPAMDRSRPPADAQRQATSGGRDLLRLGKHILGALWVIALLLLALLLRPVLGW